jgi:hypothetical protein
MTRMTRSWGLIDGKEERRGGHVNGDVTGMKIS